MKKNLLQKFRDVTAQGGKIPRKYSEDELLAKQQKQRQQEYLPITVNNFSYLKKGEGTGKNFIATKTSFGRCTKLEYMDSLQRTFMKNSVGGSNTQASSSPTA